MMKRVNLNDKNMSYRQQQGFVFSFLLLVAMIAGLVFFAVYCIGLDRTVVNKFEGKRWNIPAKVYSRPLEMYQGANIDEEMLKKWLDLLNYKKGDHSKTGSYEKRGSTYEIHTRGFVYHEKEVDRAQVIKVHFAGGQIDSVASTIPNDSGVIRLEPVDIGGIYPDNNEDRVIIGLAEVPEALIAALLATEDRNFYTHKGVSLRGVARALLNNLTNKSMQGGSTITQQLIKNFYLNSERTLSRKANEALMAILLELHYSKSEILQAYLNEINLGQNGTRSINGFGLASQFYFGRPLNEISVDQMALLVGLAKGPSYYNPRRHPDRALQRRNVVLHNMLTQGNLTQAEYEALIERPLGVVEKPTVGKSRFPDFLDIVKRELYQDYLADDLKNEGLKIISTLDPLAQTAADSSMVRQLNKLRKANKSTKNLEGALVSADPQTGELMAVVGSSRGFTGFNRAVDAKRQVGSLLKPVVYLIALESGDYNLASPVDDSTISIDMGNGKRWTPKNYANIEHDDVPLITALANSYNKATVRVGMEFGVNSMIQQLRMMGIKEKISPYPSALLGAVNLSPMEMLAVYQVFATGGFKTPIHSIRSVADNEGRLLQRSTLSTEIAVSAPANYLINYALQEVVKNGTGRRALELGKDLNLAGKTGTTNDYKDAWFAGYSGNVVSVVWVGRDDNKPIGLSGSNGALPIWVDYMKKIPLTPVELATPQDIEWLWLEENTGKLTQEDCPNARYLPVIKQFIPEQASDCTIALYEAEQDQIRAKEAEAEAETQAEEAAAEHGTNSESLESTTENTQEPNQEKDPVESLLDGLADIFKEAFN